MEKYHNLSFRLSVISICALALLLGLYIYFSYADVLNSMENQEKDQLVSIVQKVRTSIEDQIDASNRSKILTLCQNLAGSDTGIMAISYYKIVDENGNTQLLASSKPLNPNLRLTKKDIANSTFQAITYTNMYLDGKKHVLRAVAPVYIGGMPTAILAVHMDMSSKDAAATRYLLRALMFAFIGLLIFAPLIYVRIKKDVHKPIRRLIEGSQEVAKGNLDQRMNLNRKDEIGILSQEFDNMTEILKQKEEEREDQIKSLKEKWIRAEENSRTDFLTNLENHRSFHSTLKAEINRANRTGVKMTLLFCDMDFFKVYNDENGHLYGDRALFEVAEIIQASIRDYDVAARYGGEEFTVILPGTDAENAMIVAERIRKNVEQHIFKAKTGDAKMTISIGMASFPEDANKKDELLAAADRAMYMSKTAGRNAITKYSSDAANPGKEKAS